MRAKTLGFLLCCGVAVLAGGAGALLAPPVPASNAIEWLPTPRPIPDFALHESFNHESLSGQWTFLSFGYTHCPDVCPMTLAQLAELHQSLAEETAAFVFVSVDPRRDTPARLQEYTDWFSPAILGVSGEPKALEQLNQAVGARFSTPNRSADDDYAVGHSTAVFVFDPAARLRGRIKTPFKPMQVAEAFRLKAPSRP